MQRESFEGPLLGLCLLCLVVGCSEPTPPADRPPAFSDLSLSYNTASAFVSLSAAASDPDGGVVEIVCTGVVDATGANQVRDSVEVQQTRESQPVEETCVGSSGGAEVRRIEALTVPPLPDDPPVVTIAGDTVRETRDSVRVTVTALDDYEVRRVLVDWGDARADTVLSDAASATLHFAHLYADTGRITVTARATDDTDRSRDATHVVRVYRMDTLTVAFIDLQSGTSRATRGALTGVHVRVLEAPDSALVADTTVDGALTLFLRHGPYYILPSHPAMIPEVASLVWNPSAHWGDGGAGVSRAGAPVAVPHIGRTELEIYLHDAAALPLDTIEWWGLWRTDYPARRFEADWTLWVDTGTVAWSAEQLDRLPDLIDIFDACQSMRVAHPIEFRDTILARAPDYPTEVNDVIHISGEGGYGFGESPEKVRIGGNLRFDGYVSWPADFGTVLYVLGVVHRFDMVYDRLVLDDGTGRYILSDRGRTLCNAHGALPTGSILR